MKTQCSAVSPMAQSPPFNSKMDPTSDKQTPLPQGLWNISNAKLSDNVNMIVIVPLAELADCIMETGVHRPPLVL